MPDKTDDVSIAAASEKMPAANRVISEAIETFMARYGAETAAPARHS